MSTSSRISSVLSESIVDGYGLRMVIFFQGCELHCPYCHNPQTWDLNGGKLVTNQSIQKLWKKDPLLKGITVSGGEPFLQIDSLLDLVKLARKDKLDVIIYTGFTYEQLIAKKDKRIDEILNSSQFLIDGPFIYEKKSLSILYRGSTNQRIIDLEKTNRQKEVIEVEKYEIEQE